MKLFKIIPFEENSDHFFNIKPSSEFIPEWYRLAKNNVDGVTTELMLSKPSLTSSTFKKCTPFVDAMMAGYTAYLTADLEVVKSEEGNTFVVWRTQRTMVTKHDDSQWNGVPVPYGYQPIVFKWHNQFGLNVPKGYSLLFCNPINQFNLPFQTVTGIVDCDKYGGPVHFPFFLRDGFTGIIPAGTPITQIIPVKREQWKKEHVKYNKNTSILFLEKYLSTIKRSYKNNYWTKKDYT
jgi:hypothetical protein